ncbi:MAG TPA: hypothetical protein VII31_03655 [Caldimonas sp.]
MSPLRLLALTAACGALVAPLAGIAAPSADSSACAVRPMTLTERRISEEAAKGLPALISFVNLTAPIYQARVVDAVAWLDARKERRAACATALARATPS